MQTCLAALYSLISMPFFWVEASTTLVIMAACDFLMLLALIVVAVLLGRPLSHVDCFAMKQTSRSIGAATALSSFKPRTPAAGILYCYWSG